MVNQELLMGYLEWAIIIILTSGLFSYFSKRYENFFMLFTIVLIPVWLIAAIIKGIEYIIFKNNYYSLLSLRGFIGLLAFTLPMLFLFGGITFAIKYRKFRKKNVQLKANNLYETKK